MPDTRPGMLFDDEGICLPCRVEEKKDKTDWKARYEELKKLCSKYRSKDNEYDCIIAVSGGKDSHFQTHVFKERMGMNPLLVSVEDNMPMTNAGAHNIKNISEEFGCDIISLKPNLKAQKKIMRKMFEKFGKPDWLIERLIYTYPLHIAVKFGIPLLVYGENVSYEYGGPQREETYSARQNMENGVALSVPHSELVGDGVTEKDLIFCEPPPLNDLKKVEPIYTSYFIRWSSWNNYQFAMKRGFHDLTHEWKREHHIEDFDQIDTRAYLVHSWIKYPKFGHSSATDYAAKFIRYGMMTREEGVKLVNEHDHKLDPLAVRDFCEFLGYRESEFWAIIDKFYNKDIFIKDENGQWKMKKPLR